MRAKDNLVRLRASVETMAPTLLKDRLRQMEESKAELGLAHKARRWSGKGKPHDFQMATAADEGRKRD